MMQAMSLSQLLPHTGGTLTGDAQFRRVHTDTRTIAAGDCFVALAGEHFDGNQFVGDAAAKGAVAAIVSRANVTDMPHLQVEDTRIALGRIARVNRRLFKGVLLALTGSSGKTGTKQMLAAILAQCGDVLATEGNLNNEIGVPQTLLRIEPRHAFAVIEMGASHRGDIAYLCQFAEPDIALLTNVMPAHIEGFGSLDGVAETKAEIFDVINGGTCIINLDDNYSAQWLNRTTGKQRLTFSLHDDSADIFATGVSQDVTGCRFTLHVAGEQAAVTLPLLGIHNVMNALAASAAAIAAGASLADCVTGLATIKAMPGRLFPIALSNQLLIDDSYNANPGSVKAAINVAASLSPNSCLVLGHMGELGEQSESLHREVGAYARAQQIKMLWAVGPMAEQVVQAFGEGGRVFQSRQAMIDACEQGINADVILVKGSRSAAMEKVVEVLKQKTIMETP